MTGIEGRDMIERERVVGIPRALTAGPHVEREMGEKGWKGIEDRSPSAHKYSRTDERTTARPSARRENGVRPAPFN
jgi:hypothetical protein